MVVASRKYPAKLLLFGEYTVLHGGQALAVPYEKYFGTWQFLPKGAKPEYDLLPFIEYLKSCTFLANFDLEAFTIEIERGLFFDSTIPNGYGAGSSGAFCAGVWDRFGSSIEVVESLRNIFIEMESFFHGKSSGLDPLVSYLNQPVLLEKEKIEVLEMIHLPDEIRIFDSGISRSTEPLVAWYKTKIEQDEVFKKQVLNTLLPLNTLAIQAFLKNDILRLREAFKAISQWQFKYFSPLIPDTVQFKQFQEKESFLKLCGAGGGGFYLEFRDLNLPLS